MGLGGFWMPFTYSSLDDTCKVKGGSCQAEDADMFVGSEKWGYKNGQLR